MNWNTIRNKLYKLKVKILLKDRRLTNRAIYEITSAFLTERILSGEGQFRPELEKMQKLVEEDNKFIKFLDNLK